MRTVALRGAWLVDGTGAPRRRGTVVLAGERIAAVAREAERVEADAVVDLDGLVLAPGFIDPHTHYDAQVLWDRDLTPSSWHGVTTVVIGNTGFGVSPTRPRDRETILRTLENVEGMSLPALEAGVPWTFETFPDYLDALASEPTRLNVAVLVGHTPVRTWVMGDEATEHEATEDEVAEMRRLVGEALDAGALGFSTSRSESHRGAYGLPVPSRAARLEEIYAVAGALAERRRGVVEATWGPDLFVEEFADLSRTLRRPVVWAALLAVKGNPDYACDVADRTERSGDLVWAQISCRPIVAQLTLADPAPFANVPAFGEILGLAHDERAARYADPEWLRRAAVAVEERWAGKLAGATVQETEVHLDLRNGPTLAEIGEARGTGPLEAMVHLALSEDLRTRFQVVMVNDDDDQIAGLLQRERLVLGLSDAGAHATQLCDANFPTYLLSHWVRDRGDLTIEQAVWRMTGHPAQVFCLPDRGRLAPGLAADLVAFDPAAVASAELERVRDFPGGADRLVARSIGIERVWVAGAEILRGGELVEGARPGRLLRAS